MVLRCSAFVPCLSPTCFWLCGCSGPHVILHLSPPFLPHLSPGCPPLDSHCLEVRCGCSGPHESTLVSRAVGALSNLHLSPSCLPLPGSALDQLSPSWLPGSPLSKKGVDALDLLTLDLSPTCLPVCCRCPGPEWLALRVLWAPWFCSCLPLVSQYAVDALSCMVLHLSPTCPALVSDCLAVCFGFSGPPDSTLVSRLFPACPPLFPSMLWALWATCLYTWWRAKKLSATKQSLYIYIYISNIFCVFSVSIIHLIIGVPDFDLYALVSCLSLTVA